MMQQGVELSREEQLTLKNRRTGLIIFQISWIMVFVVLIVVNLTLRNESESWPPAGVDKLGAVLPTAATVLLIISTFAARNGLLAIKADDKATFKTRWWAALLLGGLFVLAMATEWVAVPVSGKYSNIFRVMVGFHAVHALAIGAYMWHIYRHAEQHDARNFWPVEAATSLWYFVTFAWVLFFLVLYVI